MNGLIAIVLLVAIPLSVGAAYEKVIGFFGKASEMGGTVAYVLTTALTLFFLYSGGYLPWGGSSSGHFTEGCFGSMRC
jgi:hypothetical protein